MSNELLYPDCQDCLYWFRHGPDAETGDCRFNPPTVFRIQQVNPIARQVNEGCMSIYPPTGSQGKACGKFRPRKEKLS